MQARDWVRSGGVDRLEVSYFGSEWKIKCFLVKGVVWRDDGGAGVSREGQGLGMCVPENV